MASDSEVRILVVDDELDIRDACGRVLSRSGYSVRSSGRGVEALATVMRGEVDVLLLDLRMPGMDGMEVLRRIRERGLGVVVIVITGHATVETAVEALKAGAYDFISKPLQSEHLRIVVGRAADRVRLSRRTLALEEARRSDLQDLDAEKSRLRTVVESLPDGVIVTDAAGRVVLLNETFHRLSAQRERSMPGKPLNEYVADDELREIVMRVIDGREAEGATREVRLGDIDCLAEVRAVSGDGGACLGAVLVFVDIRAMKHVDRLKSEFVSRVSHDLQSPLSTIRNQLSVVLGDLGDAPQARDQHLLSRAVDRTNELLALIGDLLDLSRLEEGSYCRESQSVDLAEFLRSAVERIRPDADSRSQEILLQIAPDLLHVQTDPVALQGVFGNLLSNAVKYTPAGGRITVGAAVRAGRAEVSVADTGIGIAREDLDRVFERFYRVDSEHTRSNPGTGLGLPIVRGLVDALNGELGVESEPGRGSTFTVTL